MKRRELQKCVLCKRGLAHAGSILFYRVTLERFGFDRRGLEERAGLEMMFGGGFGVAALAEVMGTDSDIAVPIGGARTVLICDPCSMETHCLASIAEIVANTEEKELRT